MKKIFGTIVLTITLSLLIVLLALNITLKQMINGIVSSSWKTLINVSEKKEGNFKDFIDEYVSEDIDTSEIGDLWNSFVGEDGEISSSKIDDIINTNKEKIKEMTGIDISGDMIEDVEEAIKNKDLNKVIEAVMDSQEQRLSPSQRFWLNVAKWLITARMRGILIVCIIINIILLALVQFSFYKWIKPFAWASVISGGLLLAIGYGVQSFLDSIKYVTVSMGSTIHIGILLLIGGIVLRIGYLVVGIILGNMKENKKEEKEKKKTKKDEENEVS